MIRDYHYLDVTGIEHLYAQTCDQIEKSREETVERKIGGKAQGKVSTKLGELLSLLGLQWELEIEADLQKETIKSEKVIKNLNPENKLRIIIEYFNKHKDPKENRFYNGLKSGLEEATRSQEAVFVEFDDKFNIELNVTDQIISLELAADYRIEGKKCNVRMGGSLSKWRMAAPDPEDNGRFIIAQSSHLASMLRERAFVRKIYAFGSLYQTKEDIHSNNYYIKPYAISL
jgi:hypothetical protein